MQYKKIIREIEKIRKHNNQKWMQLLSIAIEYAPKKSSKVIKDINSNDLKISKLFKKLSNKK